jgi:hypothetical protein
MRSIESLSRHATKRDGGLFVRSQPQMYLHQLAHYLDARPGERRELVEAAKYPSPTSSPAGSEPGLAWDEDLATSLALQFWWCITEPGDRPDGRRARARVALKLFVQLVETINHELALLGARTRLTRWVSMSMSLGGVKLVDSPLLIAERNRHGRLIDVGVLSFATSRARAHTDESMKNAAVLLWSLARAELGSKTAQLSRRRCIVADAFSFRSRDARIGHQRRLRKAEIACEEIAAIWPEL